MPAYDGRPTKYKKEYCKGIVELMSEGYTAKAYAGHIGVDMDTITEWTKRHRDFSLARRKGEAAAEKYLITLGKALITGKIKGNAIPWLFMCKNMLGWTDRTDLRIEVHDEYNKEFGLLKSVPRKDLIELAKLSKKPPGEVYEMENK